jgi:hypothetical protein
MSNSDPTPPPKKTQAEYAYQDEQQRLTSKVSANRGKVVVLDPDGSWSPWLLVAIKSQTDVIYENQCAGTGCDHRLIEGFVIPVSGPWLRAEEGSITNEPFMQVFHQGNSCVWSWTGNKLPKDRLDRLRSLVENIPYWRCEGGGGDQRLSIKLDEGRIFEIAEGWIPIITDDGPGVLLFQNCD